VRNLSRYFNSSPEVIRLRVMLDIRSPLSLRQVEDLLFEPGIDICRETVRLWWYRFGPMFAAAIQNRRSVAQWRPVRPDQHEDSPVNIHRNSCAS
jgi:putative transposase